MVSSCKRLVSLVSIFTLIYIFVLAGVWSITDKQVQAASATGSVSVIDSEADIAIQTSNYHIDIEKKGFVYSFSKPDGSLIAEGHENAGISFTSAGDATLQDAEDTTLIHYDDEQIHLEVSNKVGGMADVYIFLESTYVQMQVIPQASDDQDEQDEFVLTQSSDEAEGLIATGDDKWVNYTIETSIMLSAHDNSSAGIIYRYIDDDNYYHFRVNEGDGTVQLLKKENGNFEIVEETPYSLEGNIYYDLKVEVTDNETKAYLDGSEILTFMDEGEYHEDGLVGIRTWRDYTRIKSFKVTQGEDTIYEDDFINEQVDEWDMIKGNWSFQKLGSSEDGFIIDARTAPINPAYGLGDEGRKGESSNVFGVSNNDLTNKGGEERFISNFTIFPSRDFAQVLFEEDRKRVTINEFENKLGVANVESIDKLYYFFGDVKQIYADYQLVRAENGYEEFLPKYDFFEVGYEAFGSLGWNTYQTSVMDDLQTYLDKDYRLKWGVVGSGFWKGDRQSPYQGATTSFGIWDDTQESGRTDDLPNPRYPDVDGLKQFFNDNNMRLFLGLRTNFKATTENGGRLNEDNDGNYTNEGLNNHYFLGAKDRDADTFKVNFPEGNVHLLDSMNQDALDWYQSGVDKWGVDGFKEDTMLASRVYHDGLWNQTNARLMENDYYVMVRNAAYSVSGDIMRYEDTQHGFNQDRPVINALNYAASGAPNVYSDIVAGKYIDYPLTDDQKEYFTRNAMYAALTPAMSMGLGPWHMENDSYESIVKKAVDFHSMYAPYIYSAAVDSYQTGFPFTMTPLPIAFPEDEQTYNLANRTTRQYQWMIGESMLATPAYGNDYATVESRDVYLPTGKWIDYETGDTYQGPQTLKDFELPKDKIPVFIGGKGVIVHQDLESEAIFAEVYPIVNEGSQYVYTAKDGETKSTISNNNEGWNKDTLIVINQTSNEVVPFEYDNQTGAFIFEIKVGDDYELTGGKHHNILDSLELSTDGGNEILIGDALQLSAEAYLDNGESVDISNQQISYISENEDVAEVSDVGVVVGKTAGTTQIYAILTIGDITVQSLSIDINVRDYSLSINAIEENSPVRHFPLQVSGRANGIDEIELMVNDDVIEIEVKDNSWNYQIDYLDNGKYTIDVSSKKGIGSSKLKDSLDLYVNVGETMLHDKFDGEALNEELWHIGSGDWNIVQQNDKQCLGESSDGAGILYTGDKSDWENYVLTASLNLEGVPGGSGGIIFRYTDQNNFYHFRLDQDGNTDTQTAQLYKWVDGSATKLAEKPFEFTDNQWYNLQITVQDDEIKGFIDGNFILEVRDDSHANGGVGFRSYYKQLNVKSIDVSTFAAKSLLAIELIETAEVLALNDVDILQVLAYDSDGEIQDVTERAQYESSDDTVVSIGEKGELHAVGSGSSTITVLYEGLTTEADIIVYNPKIEIGESFEAIAGKTYAVVDSSISIQIPPNLPEGTVVRIDNPSEISINKEYEMISGVYELIVEYPPNQLYEEDYILTLAYENQIDSEHVNVFQFHESDGDWEEIQSIAEGDKFTVPVQPGIYSVLAKVTELESTNPEEGEDGDNDSTTDPDEKETEDDEIDEERTESKNPEEDEDGDDDPPTDSEDNETGDDKVDEGEAESETNDSHIAVDDEDEKEVPSLPKTSTNHYNWFGIGIILFLLGITSFIAKKRKV